VAGQRGQPLYLAEDRLPILTGRRRLCQQLGEDELVPLVEGEAISYVLRAQVFPADRGGS
jgi:hypothetical protein